MFMQLSASLGDPPSPDGPADARTDAFGLPYDGTPAAAAPASLAGDRRRLPARQVDVGQARRRPPLPQPEPDGPDAVPRPQLNRGTP